MISSVLFTFLEEFFLVNENTQLLETLLDSDINLFLKITGVTSFVTSQCKLWRIQNDNKSVYRNYLISCY